MENNVRKLVSTKLIALDIILFLIAVFTLSEVLLHGFLTAVDSSINAFIPTIQNSFLIGFSKILNVVFDTPVMLVLSLILSVLIWYKYSKKEAIFFASTMIVDAVAIFIIKLIVHRARPLNALITAKDYAFPSGHTVTAVVFFGLLSYLLLKHVRSDKIKPIIIGVAAIMILLISLSRIYLNVHWMSDVLGGLAIGGVVLTTSVMIHQSK